MKKIPSRTISLLLLFFVFSSGIRQNETQQIVAFGDVRHNGNRLGGVSVKLYQGDELIEKIVTTRYRGYGFQLEYHKNYRIIFSKVGYLEQTVLINTSVTDEVLSYGDRLLWEPQFSLIKALPGLGITEIAQPVSSYIFDEEYWGFIEDSGYKQEMKQVLQSLNDTIHQLEQATYHKEQLTGDSLYTQEVYPEAIMAYNRASAFNPNDKELRKKVKTAKKMLKKQSSAEESYSEAIAKADSYFSEKAYEEANSYYQKSLLFKPDEIYPQDRLYEIDSIQSYEWIARNDRFDALVLRGDSLMNEIELIIAKENFMEASLIFPEKKYPKMMVLAIDSIIENSAVDPLADTPSADTSMTPTSKPSLAMVTSITNSAATATMEPTTKKKRIESATPQRKDSILIDTFKTNLNTVSPHFTSAVSETIDSTPSSYIDTITIVEPSSPPILSTPEENPEVIKDAVLLSNYDTLLAYGEKDKEESLNQLQKDLDQKILSGDKAAEADIYDQMGLVYQSEYELGKALESFEASLTIKQELGDKAGEVKALSNMASVLYDSGSYHNAIGQFERSLEIAQEIDDKEQSADIMESIATVYENTYRYDEALEKLQESLIIQKELGDEQAVSELHGSMGNIYYEQNNFDEAIEALKKAARIEARVEQKDELSTTYNSLGAAYYNKNDLDQSLSFYEKSLEFSRETNNKKLQALTLNNLGNVNFSSEKYQKAIEYYQQSLQLKEEIAFPEGIAATLHNTGNAFFRMKHYDKALEYYSSSQELAQRTHQYEIIWRNYRAFAKSYAAKGRFKTAYENYELYTSSKFDEYGQSEQLIELRENYESSKLAVKTLKRELQKQSRIARYEAERNRREMQIVELEIENKRQQLKKQRYVIISFIFGTLLILGFAFIITRQYKLTQKAYRLVAKQKQDITQGISYAARIQSAVLPPQNFIENNLPEHFILYKPCEVVSGDFYWVGMHFGKTVIAVADCTGHGVPGGFMSMLGVALLNEILSSETPLESHEILTQLRDRVVEALHQKGGDSESLDGMDISLLILDQQNLEIQFSAAYHSLYIISQGEMRKIKGDRVPIGFHFKTKPFTSKKEQLQQGDVLYMTTDGYPDQIGHKDQRRLMLGPFREMLMNIHQKPMMEQKNILDTHIEDWRGTLPQTDDMLVFGIRI